MLDIALVGIADNEKVTSPLDIVLATVLDTDVAKSVLLFVTATVLIGVIDGENVTGRVISCSLLDSTLVVKYIVEAIFPFAKLMVLA